MLKNTIIRQVRVNPLHCNALFSPSLTIFLSLYNLSDTWISNAPTTRPSPTCSWASSLRNPSGWGRGWLILRRGQSGWTNARSWGNSATPRTRMGCSMRSDWQVRQQKRRKEPKIVLFPRPRIPEKLLTSFYFCKKKMFARSK